MTWPTTNAPATAPTTHGPVRTQAYYAGGGDYFRSGYYSHGIFHTGTVQGKTIGQNTLFVRPFFVPVRRAFDRIGIYVTAGTASSAIRLGIYSPADGRPGALHTDAGTVSGTAVGAPEATISVTLDPGIWWLACVSQGASAAVAAYQNLHTPWSGQFTTVEPVNSYQWPVQSGVTGALPSSFAPSGTTASIAAVQLRAA